MRALPAILALLVAACGGAPRAATTEAASMTDDDRAHAEAWTAWRARRRESLGGEDGWLTLIGLAWLEAPEVTIGSDPSSGIVLPAEHAPARVGRFVVREGAAAFVPESGVAITRDGEPVVAEVAMAPDVPGPPTRLAVGSIRFHVIARAGRLGVRIKDRESPARAGFTDTVVWDRDLRWRVRARFVAAAEGETLPIVDVLGQTTDEPLAGRLRFELDGQAIELLATWNGTTPADGLWVMFRDATSDADDGSYPAGRYLEVAAPDAGGETWVDFNFAYTPPCAYTDHATCPLPPPENEIPIAITAGERAPAAH